MEADETVTPRGKSELGGKTYGAPLRQNELGGKTYGAPLRQNELGGKTYGASLRQNELGGKTYGAPLRQNEYVLPSLKLYAMDWPRRLRRQRSGHPRRSSSTPGHHHRHNNNSNNNEDEDTNNTTTTNTNNNTSVPKADLYMLSEFPKQFVLSAHEEDDDAVVLNLDRSLSDTDADLLQEVPRDPAELRRLARELEAFEDMDYMLPGHLHELLRQEGVDEQVVDSTVALERVWHDRALYLNHVYHVRRRKFLARPSRYSSLPPINRHHHHHPPSSSSSSHDPSLPPPSHDVDARRERRENRSRPWDVQDPSSASAETAAGKALLQHGDNSSASSRRRSRDGSKGKGKDEV
ncbi:uncharacterized protein LOC143275726 [Babylonia areolata]|uniref:uncharacterized protein LOC143275726 n=1 Tax=Babylonia areolata TaxID=304850 RepID=UPI003FD28C08